MLQVDSDADVSLGGARIQLNGGGFPRSLDDVYERTGDARFEVRVGDHPCAIVSSNSTVLTCDVESVDE